MSGEGGGPKGRDVKQLDPAIEAARVAKASARKPARDACRPGSLYSLAVAFVNSHSVV